MSRYGPLVTSLHLPFSIFQHWRNRSKRSEPKRASCDSTELIVEIENRNGSSRAREFLVSTTFPLLRFRDSTFLAFPALFSTIQFHQSEVIQVVGSGAVWKPRDLLLALATSPVCLPS